MSDLVERLRKAAIECEKNSYALEPIGALLKEAADEIERLRSVAGAVSRGPSQREIKTASCLGGVTDLFGGSSCTRVPGEE